MPERNATFPRGSRLAKGEVPLPPGVPEARAHRFEDLRDAIEARECSECIGHDQSRPGADPHGRFALHAMGDGGRSELTRCSSHARAQVVAGSHLAEGWTVLALYDLDETEDDDTPQRYDVAGIVQQVIFNTVPTVVD